MKKRAVKNSDDEEVVTKGFLKEKLNEFRREIDRNFLLCDERFNKLDNVLLFIVRELNAMREENREIRQMREQLYNSDVQQGFQIADHEERIHKLEIAR